MHDIADLDRRGVVGVFVATDEFADAAAAQGRALGFEAPAVYVAHPVQDRTDDELTEIATAAVDEVVGALTSAPPAGAADHVESAG